MPNHRKPVPPGTRFHQLTAIEFSHRTPSGHSYQKCRCDCGNIVVVQESYLRSGHTKSCGCRKGITGVRDWTTHGVSRVKGYDSWHNAIARCYDTTQKNYHAYGGRGIRVCEFIRTSPRNLLDLIGERPPKLTIDRIDNSGHYSCGQCAECLKCGWKMNVRWAPKEVQSRNTRQNRWLTYNGETKILKDWARDAGIPRKTFENRLKRGVDPFKNIQSPAQRAHESSKTGA